MSFTSSRPLMNGSAGDPWTGYNDNLRKVNQLNQEFHGDKLLADKVVVQTGLIADLWKVLTFKNFPEVLKVLAVGLSGKGLDVKAGAQLIGSLSNDSKAREELIESSVKSKYDKMLHPPLTYLGDAFQYRSVDGKYNSVLNPQLGAAGTPYARTVPSKTHSLGARPDPGDVFEKLMRRQTDRPSKSGLSSMLVYHATIIIHDIFRTNDKDKNISDSSSYLDLSPLYGYNEKTMNEVRDQKFKLGLLNPDAFAEDRLLRQPPGVCIMLVMYNRYHNYVATQLKRINENGRFSVPAMFDKPKWVAVAESEDCIPADKLGAIRSDLEDYQVAWEVYYKQGLTPLNDSDTKYKDAEEKIIKVLDGVATEENKKKRVDFLKLYDAAWNKLDTDLFNTARLITCGMYINISVHDYLRALMGFHQYDTNFTLEPRTAMNHKNVTRGLGNQVTVEFNLLYRFHCAISRTDEDYLKEFMREALKPEPAEDPPKSVADDPQPSKLRSGAVRSESSSDPSKSKVTSAQSSGEDIDMDNLSMPDFIRIAKKMGAAETKDPSLVEFGLNDSPKHTFKRNLITGLFDDEDMISHLLQKMDDPISNFGPQNVPGSLKNVEILGITQARKWDIGTLNDFRDFFELKRHETFESITGNVEVQNALRDLYDHPDQVELYPGIFCESDKDKNVDPGPSGIDSALWAAIFSDAITLVRSDRFYTVDWNTKSLTSWGMKEVTPDNDICKSSVFHRLLQRAFPEWFPYDSIRFFHPFYTGQTNGRYATEQGYAKGFAMKQNTRAVAAQTKQKYDVQASQARKPPKPVFLSSYDQIQRALAAPASQILNPAFTIADDGTSSVLPKKVSDAIKLISTQRCQGKFKKTDHKALTRAYIERIMRLIVQREAISMDSSKGKTVYQVDVTRDVAIPVVTRCIADFLGFGHQIKDVGNPHAKYSENEIYQHITNCQVFLSYNADETKLMKRRKDFKESMQFLLKLAEEGNVLAGSRWPISKALRSLAKRVVTFFESKETADQNIVSEHMKVLGRVVASQLYENVKDSGITAALLLITALDIAYVSVLAFTTSLDLLLEGAYEAAKDPGKDWNECNWAQLQQLAMKGDNADHDAIEKIVKDAQRKSIKLPFIRQVVADGVQNPAYSSKKNPKKDDLLKKGQMIICDIHAAMNPEDSKDQHHIADLPHLNYASSLSTSLIDFNPKEIAMEAQVSMIKVMAQMVDLRRGHTAQGSVKQIDIDQTNEGYANFMAPARMKMIQFAKEHAVEQLADFKRERAAGKVPDKTDAEKRAADEKERLLEQRIVDGEKVFDTSVLKPAQTTFLTAEWDEMIPFPTTWKVRFEGYGPSTYTSKGGHPLDKLIRGTLPDWAPPYYQPKGPSASGGAFAGDKQVPVEATPSNLVDGFSHGCGAPAPAVQAMPEAVGKAVIGGETAEVSVGWEVD